MFTQCSQCETVFELSADVLRAAGGQVRCGHCGEIFNALARLAEDDSAFHAGESLYELETRADAILEGSAGLPHRPHESSADDDAHHGAHADDTPEDTADLAPGSEIAHLRILDEDELPADGDDDAPPDDPAIFEFTLPPGELDRIFVESKSVPHISLPAGLRSPRASPAAPGDAAKSSDTPLAAVTSLPPRDPATRNNSAAGSPPLLTAATANSLALRTAGAMRAPVSGLTVPDSVRLAMLAGAATRQATPGLEVTAVESRSSVAWWIGALALIILLALQMIHANRQALAGATLLGPAVRSVYSTLGAEVALPVDLSGYQLRQWGVSAVPDSNSALRVRASIMNVSSQLRPYPLLRVTLANRFGTKLGSRNFEPAEYAGKPIVRMLAPGERVDATLDILDPGQEAEGFEINICLRATDQHVACVGDDAPAVKR